jgi:hypothetical protein
VIFGYTIISQVVGLGLTRVQITKFFVEIESPQEADSSLTTAKPAP